MKTRMSSRVIFFTLILTLTLALPAAANITNSADGYAESFETYTNGTLIVGTNGWYSDDPFAATVMITNYAAYYTSGSYPIAASTREKALWVENNITNRFTGTTALTNYIDHVIKPTFWDEDEYPSIPENVLAAYFFNTNGQLVVLNTESYGGSVFSNTWVTIDTPSATIGTNDWIRMTIAVNFAAPEGFLVDTRNRRFYRVWLNQTPIGSELGYRHAGDEANDPDQRAPTLVNNTIETGPDRDTVRNGFWFQTGTRPNALSEVAVNGTGWLDDLVVTNDFAFLSASILASISDPSRGSITPSGTIIVDIGGGTNFVIAADPYFHISDVLIDGTPIGPTNAYTFSDVTGSRSIHAIVEADRVGDDDVPTWWMNERLGIADDFESWVTNRWHPSKPLTIGEEYWVSTDPADPDSLFKIATIGITNDMPYVQWYSDAIDPDLNIGDTLNKFLIDRATNLTATGAVWMTVADVLRYSTNTWIDTSAPTNEVFYRLRVNPAP